MKSERSSDCGTAGWATRSLVAAAALTIFACNTTSAPPPPEALAQTQSPLLTNPGFESGAAGAAPPSWTVTTALDPNPTGVTIATPETRADLNLATGGGPKTVILATAAGPQTQTDAHLGLLASLRWPRYGNQCALVNQNGNNENVNSMAQTMTVGTGDVDPMDGKIHVRFVVAPVLENPAHAANEQPYYFVQVTNVSQANAILFNDFNLSNQAGVPWKTVTTGGTSYDYTDWILNDVSPGGTAIVQGDHIKVEIIASGCSLGGHIGTIYVDGGSGSNVPGLFIVGSGPARANPGSNVTYTLTYENGGMTGETGTTVTFNLPPGTTFQSINVPAGWTCTFPAVGGTGAVVCMVPGTVAAGTGGSFQVTVNVDAGDTGTVVAGNYFISGLGSTALLGPKVITNIGCTADAQCPTGDWCDESLNMCTPTLPNGTLIPSDPGHDPTLGACSVAAGMLVCTSRVCSMGNNECGYSNGESGCTPADGPMLCQSTTCSVNGTCEPLGGCNVDADCAGGNWCNETMHLCTAQLANGTMFPTDTDHVNPMVTGTCAADAAVVVCVSGVCSTANDECGYSDGEGACTVANGPMLCQSGVCSHDGTCEPSMTCDVDADCTTGQWCNEGTHTCKPTLPNGQMIPNDPTHTNPTLGGTCSADAATLVCTSRVCSMVNQECGLSDGEGICTVGNGPMLCQSMACSTNGMCEPMGGCNVNADCTTQPGGPLCNPTTHTCGPGATDGGVPGDGGAHDGGPLDGGAHDSGLTLDSGPQLDSGQTGDDSGGAQSDASNEDAGVVEGGGCSVGSTRGTGGNPLAGALAGLGLLVAARRRKRGVKA
jgi:uncharacterized repeat protein (TIGR01451 family)/MYXO-CTERM domain-containing protein